MVLEKNPTRKHLLIEWWREEEADFSCCYSAIFTLILTRVAHSEGSLLLIVTGEPAIGDASFLYTILPAQSSFR